MNAVFVIIRVIIVLGNLVSIMSMDIMYVISGMVVSIVLLLITYEAKRFALELRKHRLIVKKDQ